jgi:hypothetical protein
LRWPGVAVGVGRNFGTTEQADALDAGRRVRQARQHQVDDVLGQIMLAGEMKILLPVNL